MLPFALLMRSYECTISLVDYYDEEAKLKLAVTTVGRRGPDEDEGCNMERFGAAELALAKAADLGADLIVLPGGFFTAHSSRARDTIANSLISKAKEIGIAIIFGIDQEVKSLSTDYHREIQRGGLPFYGYAWSPLENVIYCWAQRSTNNQNQWWAPEKACREVRLLGIGDEIAVFEPTHGSAPKYAGQNKANPMAMMLSGVMMLRYLGEKDSADKLESAIAEVIAEGKYVTYDLKLDPATAVGTSQVADAVIEKLKR